MVNTNYNMFQRNSDKSQELGDLTPIHNDEPTLNIDPKYELSGSMISSESSQSKHGNQDVPRNHFQGQLGGKSFQNRSLSIPVPHGVNNSSNQHQTRDFDNQSRNRQYSNSNHRSHRQNIPMQNQNFSLNQAQIQHQKQNQHRQARQHPSHSQNSHHQHQYQQRSHPPHSALPAQPNLVHQPNLGQKQPQQNLYPVHDQLAHHQQVQLQNFQKQQHGSKQNVGFVSQQQNRRNISPTLNQNRNLYNMGNFQTPVGYNPNNQVTRQNYGPQPQPQHMSHVQNQRQNSRQPDSRHHHRDKIKPNLYGNSQMSQKPVLQPPVSLPPQVQGGQRNPLSQVMKSAVKSKQVKAPNVQNNAIEITIQDSSKDITKNKGRKITEESPTIKKDDLQQKSSYTNSGDVRSTLQVASNTDKSPDASFTSNADTTNSQLSVNSSGKRKSNPYYESAVQDIEQEKKMVAALKRLSIGQMMNYDPESPMDNIEIQLKKQYDEPSPNLLNPQNREIVEQNQLDTLNAVAEAKSGNNSSLSLETVHIEKNKESGDEEDKEIFVSTNSLLWVPADLHPEVDPILFKAHVRTKVDEISQKLNGDKKNASSRISSDKSDNDELNTSQVSIVVSESSLNRSNSRSSAAQQSKLESISAQRFSNPSLRELTIELEQLSKSAGMDATDAVTLARTLSTSSLGYTDVEKLAFDEVSASAAQSSNRLSLISVEDYDQSFEEDPGSNSSVTSDGGKTTTSPLSSTLHLQQRLKMQYQQSQLLREKEYAERELLERDQVEDESYKQKVEKERMMKEAQHRELEQLEQRRKDKSKNSDPRPLSSREELSMKQRMQQQQREFSLKRSRRPDYRKQTHSSLGSDLQDSKKGKLADLRSNLQSGLGNIVYQASSNQTIIESENKTRGFRDSQLLFNYKKPDELNEEVESLLPASDSPYPIAEKLADKKLDHDKAKPQKTPMNGSISKSYILADEPNQSLYPSNFVGISNAVESSNPKNCKLEMKGKMKGKLESSSFESNSASQNLNKLRSEINKFKETLTQSDKDPLGSMRSPNDGSMAVESSPLPSEANDSDFSFELSYQDVSYDDPLGLDQEVLKELQDERITDEVVSPEINEKAGHDKQLEINEEILKKLVEQKALLQEKNQLMEKNSKQSNQESIYRSTIVPAEEILPTLEGLRSFYQEDLMLTSIVDSYPPPNLDEESGETKMEKFTSYDEQKHVPITDISNEMTTSLQETPINPNINKSIEYDFAIGPIFFDSDPKEPIKIETELNNTSTPKKLKKKSSFGILTGSLKSGNDENGKSSRLKKKKSWGWLRDRSSSFSAMDSSNAPPIPDNIQIPIRSISNPENMSSNETLIEKLSSGKKSLDSGTSSGKKLLDSGSSKNSVEGKENIISKLFKKKKTNQPSDSSSYSDESGDLIETKRKKLGNGNNIFRKRERVINEEEIKIKSPLSEKESSEMSVNLRGVGDKENEIRRNGEIDGNLKKMKNRLKKEVEQKQQVKLQEEEETIVEEEALEEEDNNKQFQSTLEVQEKLKKSIKKSEKANQPIEFTDSAFGFPLPPPSESTLVMLDFRFPVHVERAIYRLSHLKLANPKRSLREQVLLSNFMYAYLNLVDHTLHLEQRMNDIEEKTFDQDVPVLEDDDLSSMLEDDEDEIGVEISI